MICSRGSQLSFTFGPLCTHMRGDIYKSLYTHIWYVCIIVCVYIHTQISMNNYIHTYTYISIHTLIRYFISLDKNCFRYGRVNQCVLDVRLLFTHRSFCNLFFAFILNTSVKDFNHYFKIYQYIYIQIFHCYFILTWSTRFHKVVSLI